MPDIKTIEPKALAFNDSNLDGSTEIGTSSQRSTPIAKGEEFVIFMQNRVMCDTCQAISKLSKSKSSGHLHVHVFDEHLTVTAVDDLHKPGRAISGRRVVDFPGATVFRLEAEPAPGGSRTRHSAATGIAVLTTTRRGRSLIASGIVADSVCAHDRIFDAFELKL